MSDRLSSDCICIISQFPERMNLARIQQRGLFLSSFLSSVGYEENPLPLPSEVGEFSFPVSEARISWLLWPHSGLTHRGDAGSVCFIFLVHMNRVWVFV